MHTSEVKYIGDLRTEAVHIRSNTLINSDAPIDNKGKGEKFSPTDLVATALAQCFVSIVGIYCNEHEIPYKTSSAKVTKIMGTNPRRIVQIDIDFDFSENAWDEKLQQKIIQVGKACPVAKSLHTDIEINYTFSF